MLIQLRLKRGLHQVLGQPRQQAALTHQPQPTGPDLADRQRRQPRQQLPSSPSSSSAILTSDAFTSEALLETASSMLDSIR
ncbi:hypothetical protein GXW82_29875 [Streptacidiphilus sp. 4-A2]|nr:hypothetical protein [Streptacidiphilus sp. 4-A2]